MEGVLQHSGHDLRSDDERDLRIKTREQHHKHPPERHERHPISKEHHFRRRHRRRHLGHRDNPLGLYEQTPRPGHPRRQRFRPEVSRPSDRTRRVTPTGLELAKGLKSRPDPPCLAPSQDRPQQHGLGH